MPLLSFFQIFTFDYNSLQSLSTIQFFVEFGFPREGTSSLLPQVSKLGHLVSPVCFCWRCLVGGVINGLGSTCVQFNFHQCPASSGVSDVSSSAPSGSVGPTCELSSSSPPQAPSLSHPNPETCFPLSNIFFTSLHSRSSLKTLTLKFCFIYLFCL